MNEVCGRFRRKVTPLSLLGITSSRLRYQDLRGLTRNFSVDLPVIRSQVHLTSAAVNGFPSCHLTPSIIGPSTTIVDSSWIDTLAMLVPSGILRTPPDFCAKAGSLAHRPASAPHATNKLRSFAFICLRPSRRVGSPGPLHGLIFGGRGLFVEPHVLEAPAIKDTVDDEVETLDAGPPARRSAGVEDDRT